MAAKDIKFGTDARAKMLKGVEILAKIRPATAQRRRRFWPRLSLKKGAKQWPPV